MHEELQHELIWQHNIVIQIFVKYNYTTIPTKAFHHGRWISQMVLKWTWPIEDIMDHDIPH